MATEEYSIGYEEGYQDGWNAALEPTKKPKPVAWVQNLTSAQPHAVTDLKYCSVLQHERGEHLKYIPLYTAPPRKEWVGLTDDEIWLKTRDINRDEKGWGIKFARAIEAKLKEKNT